MDQNPSLRLLQHFCCYYTTGIVTSNNDRGSPHCEGTGTSDRSDSHVPTLEPIRATTAEYIEELEMSVRMCVIFSNFFSFILCM